MPQDRHVANDMFPGHAYPPDRRIKTDGSLHRRIKSVAANTSLGIPGLLAGCSGPLSILAPAGPNAHSVAWLWWGMFGWFTAVLVGVVVLWIYAMKRTPGRAPDSHIRRIHARWIIWGGLVLPISSITVLLAFGIPEGLRAPPLPPGQEKALRIEVTGHQWWWEVRYPDSGISLKNELHIPAGQPIDLHLTTADVIHSFWVPRLGGKLDTIPGRTNILRLHADQPGRYRGQCAEFCGRGHAHMAFLVVAHSPEAYGEWLEQERHDE